MRQFEFPYNFDKNLLKMLSILDPDGLTINCIYMPPFIEDYNTILRSEEQSKFLNTMTRKDYEEHISFINNLFPNKIQILLQKQDMLLQSEKIKYYINLNIHNFCVGSIEQAKIIKNIDNNIKIVGSITMQINEEKINQNFNDYIKYFNSFVLPFSASRNLNNLQYLPKEFEYILLINAYCNIKCNGKQHWQLKYTENEKEIKCPGLLGEIEWKDSARIRPMDLNLFDEYINVYKLQDRGWPTDQIIRDYILYTTDYSLIPINQNKELYYLNQKTNCYMTFTDEKFLPCVIKQSQRLKYLNSKYDFIVLVDKNDIKSQALLKNYNVLYKTINNQNFLDNDENQRFQKTANKFMIIPFLNEYKNICWLDADVLCSENPDKVFEELGKNTIFYSSIEKDNTIDGSFFIITDNLDIDDFYDFYNKNYKNFMTDEDVLNSYFLDKRYSIFTYNLPICFLHFSGYLKLFNLKNLLLTKLIFNLDDEIIFNKVLDNDSEKVEKIINYWLDIMKEDNYLYDKY